MIVSHKHKFIFVKTHKTATQTFLKFIKPHLGPEDVMAGDPEEINGKGELVNANTKLNIDKKFPATGKCAEDYQSVYGNHLPWFMIKEIVGDEIWSKYTKITIERDPYDRILSLFYMMNFQITSSPMVPDPKTIENKFEETKSIEDGDVRNKTRQDYIDFFKNNTIMTAYPDETREYFEEWLLAQLETQPLDLTEHRTYGSDCWVTEENEIKKTCERFNFRRILKMIDDTPLWTTKTGQRFLNFPYLKESNVGLGEEYFKNFNHFLGQCRFLNYGNYFDGSNLQVDHVIDFKNVGDNIGKCFNKHDINIQCNKNLYDQATQNAHYRKNTKDKPDNNWWYNGPRGEWLHKVIKRRFYNEYMNKNQINFNKIISGN